MPKKNKEQKTLFFFVLSAFRFLWSITRVVDSAKKYNKARRMGGSRDEGAKYKESMSFVMEKQPKHKPLAKKHTSMEKPLWRSKGAHPTPSIQVYDDSRVRRPEDRTTK
eukprot:TRINITY_DN28759_c0_g1_i1.p2 TRINITY_DN28759_c0_g1~~TRINITY_DN28759_c0_g1_i1.p2  ORF type:complete len:109 (-),score=7.55 TRINITY_DN28759_c0_g1_i1:10-336(-)